jgi:hypothetical protein
MMILVFSPFPKLQFVFVHRNIRRIPEPPETGCRFRPVEYMPSSITIGYYPQKSTV